MAEVCKLCDDKICYQSEVLKGRITAFKDNPYEFHGLEQGYQKEPISECRRINYKKEGGSHAIKG